MTYRLATIKVSKLADLIGVRAFVLGKTIFLAPDEVDEEGRVDLWLICHELMHVFQYESLGFLRCLIKYWTLAMHDGEHPMEADADRFANLMVPIGSPDFQLFEPGEKKCQLTSRDFKSLSIQKMRSQKLKPNSDSKGIKRCLTTSEPNSDSNLYPVVGEKL